MSNLTNVEDSDRIYTETNNETDNAETDLDSGDEWSSPETNKSSRKKFKHRNPTEIERLHFRLINERVVNDITLEALYKPHTLTVLGLLCAYLIYDVVFTKQLGSTDINVFRGLKALFILFLIISAMIFPNGPFIRPHPIIWRIVFGLSVLYALLLQFTLYQSYDDVKAVLSWIDPVGLSLRNLTEKEYAVNCTDVSISRIWGHMDIFAVGHFLGWAMKALMIRHTIICWYISISWELTELAFAHLLPNFQECWWDAILLDILICNGFGILFGNWVCRFLEMRQYHWESIKNIRTIHGKLRRAVLQFTPESWITVNWLKGSDLSSNKKEADLNTAKSLSPENVNNKTLKTPENMKTPILTPTSASSIRSVAIMAADARGEVSTWASTWAGLKRCIAIYMFIMIWLATELNVFFLKHVFAIDTSHPVVFWHIILICLICAPTIRQYYIYVTDPKVKRMGMQCWLYAVICALEASICIKFGREQLPSVKLWLIGLWIAFLAVGTIFCVWVSIWWTKYQMLTREVEVRGGGIRDCYLDSSCENLGAIQEDVHKRSEKMEKLSPGDPLNEVHEAAEDLQLLIDQKSYLLVNAENWESSKRPKKFEDPERLQELKDNEPKPMVINSLSEATLHLRSAHTLKHMDTLNPNVSVNFSTSQWGSSADVFAQQTMWPSRLSLIGDVILNEREVRTFESASTLSLSTFTSLLIEFVARLQNLVHAFHELSEKAKFKDAADTKEAATL